MAYELVLTPRSKRELERAPRDVFHRIDAAIRSLPHQPRPFGVEKLEDDLHRIRVGDWRILYLLRDQDRRVVITRVVRRSEKTYTHLF